MIDRRTRNIEIFADSMEYITKNQKLQEALAKSLRTQKLYLEEHSLGDCSFQKRYADTAVVVSKKRSLEAAGSYARAGKKVAVLNFASATNPGGGVKHGSSAQEEALCRCSTLYPCLDVETYHQQFYNAHRRVNNPLYNADCIYTPGVVVFKKDISFPERMKEEEWYTVAVITCAAPNLRAMPGNLFNPCAGNQQAEISKEELLKLQETRIERIFAIAAMHGIDVLILGAFGCGAFCNPPEVVAKAFANVQEKYMGCFETIEYAIYCREYEITNYEVFCSIME